MVSNSKCEQDISFKDTRTLNDCKSTLEMIFKLLRLCALWSRGGGELYLWGMKLSHKLRAGILFKLLLHRNQHCAMNDTIYLEAFLSKDEGQGLRIKNQGSRI